MTTSPSSGSPSSGSPTFGLYLNMGADLGPDPQAVFHLTVRQAELADAAGYHDLWVTEHHFIPFGLNPSALSAAGFLLGRTRRARVGTAVVLSPLVHPVDLAERAALLDQLSDGRFDLGIGRGGYLADYQVLDVDTTRWDDEPERTARRLLELWQGAPVGSRPGGPDPLNGSDGLVVQPPPRTTPHPPLLLATSTGKGVACAAEHGLPLQHYFATPAPARVALEDRYDELRTAGAPAPAHLHTLIVIVTDDPDGVRARLAETLTRSFIAGDHPTIPRAANRHVGPDGRPLDRATMASYVARSAIVGPPGQVVDELGTFIAETGARRLALYTEAIAEPRRTLDAVERFAGDVAPALTGPRTEPAAPPAPTVMP